MRMEKNSNVGIVLEGKTDLLLSRKDVYNLTESLEKFLYNNNLIVTTKQAENISNWIRPIIKIHPLIFFKFWKCISTNRVLLRVFHTFLSNDIIIFFKELKLNLEFNSEIQDLQRVVPPFKELNNHEIDKLKLDVYKKHGYV